MRYVIIGNSVASAGCIEGIRMVDLESEIVVLSDEPYHMYSRPLISYWLSKKVTDVYYRPIDYYEKYRIIPLLGKKVIRVDFENKTIALAAGEKINYDKLLIATGGKPFIPTIPGTNKKNVFTFVRFDDVKEIDRVISVGANVIVVGAGLSGLKAVEALLIRNCNVIVVELAGRILGSILDEEGAKIVQDVLEEKGVRFLLENSVTEILGEETVKGVRLKSSDIIPTDILIFAIGVVPNIDIFKDTPLKINRGILINEKMETNIPNVYAAGDVVEALDVIAGGIRVIPIFPNAYIQGEVAGLNMAGKEAIYKGGFPMNSIGFFDTHIMSAGLVNPSQEMEVLKRFEPNKKIYRKIYLKDGRILGFMFINSIDRTGMIVDLMKNGIDVSNFKDRLLSDNFGFLDLPKEFRRERILGV
ncbi:MAG: NAD(P)/FAD-dependent oxidoreductase [bacterium]